GGEIKSARRFDQKAKSVASAHDGKRCFRRTEHARIAAMRGGGGEPSGKAFCGRAVAGRDQKTREAAKGRGSGLLASVDLSGVKRVAIVRRQRPDDGVLRLVRLQIAAPLSLLAAGAAADLLKHLERPLGGARVAVGEA